MEGETTCSATSMISELKLSLNFATPITPGFSLLYTPLVKKRVQGQDREFGHCFSYEMSSFKES